MKRKTVYALGVIMMLSLAGCGSAEQAGKDVAAEQTSEQESTAGGEETVQPEEEGENTEQESDTDSEAEAYLEKYDYVLCKDGKALIGFNYPHKQSGIALGGMGMDNKAEYYSFNDESAVGMSPWISLLQITVDELELQEDGSMRNPAKGMTYTVEKKETVDTPYGNADIYFATDEEGQNEEIASLAVGEHTVIMEYSGWEMEEYEGVLKEYLPLMFEPIERTEDQNLVLEDNRISVDTDTYSCFIESNSDEGDVEKYAIGFQSLEGRNGWSFAEQVCSEEEDGNVYPYLAYYNNETFERLSISNVDEDYRFFFGGRSLVEMEEKGTCETPFGTAKLFYATRKDTDPNLREQVAVLRNMGTTIVIEYYSYTEPERGYDDRLQELLSLLF